jgi:hypothetical protein
MNQGMVDGAVGDVLQNRLARIERFGCAFSGGGVLLYRL